jgi:hypothetical protein
MCTSDAIRMRHGVLRPLGTKARKLADCLMEQILPTNHLQICSSRYAAA